MVLAPDHRVDLTQAAGDAALQAVELLALGLVVLVLTRRRRDVRPLTDHAPAAAVSRRELAGVLGYGAVALGLAWAVPKALGWHPFSWHLAGTLRGIGAPPRPVEMVAWAAFCGIAFALVPWLWARRRSSLPLHSTNLRADTVLVVVVLALELTVQTLVLRPATLDLDPRTLLAGAVLTFVLYLVGAVLPTVVLVEAVMLPRVLAVTGSTAVTVAAGGLAYALFHLWDHGVMDQGLLVGAALLLLTYAGPGAFKAWMTVRTGNAWTHAWAYHALAPHVLVDTALVVQILDLG